MIHNGRKNGWTKIKNKNSIFFFPLLSMDPEMPSGVGVLL
jgi:hypothetical protein